MNLLSNVKHSDVLSDPFPHIISTDPIEPELCSKLISEFPSLETVAQGASISSNQRFSYSAKDSLVDPTISPLWREFVKANTSQAFLQEFTSLFKAQIRETYPNFEKEVGLENLKAGTRNIDDFKSANVLLDAQICVNTPVTGSPSSVKRGHVDLPNKLFAGLYYLRDPQDTSTGGDLEIYKFKDKVHGFQGQFIDDKYLELVKTVKYERNILVLFLNSSRSLHGVTLRSTTNSPRLFFNLIGEVNCPLFSLEEHEEKSRSDKPNLPKGLLKNIKKMMPFVAR